jgi:hypothetical protein
MVDDKESLRCSYCGIRSRRRGDMKRCRLCKDYQCLFHREPEEHGCDAIEWEEERGHDGLGVMDLLKGGAFVLALLLIIRIAMGMIDGSLNWLGVNAGRAKRVAKANAAVFVAVPALLMLLSGMFPQSADIVSGAAEGILGSLDLDIPQGGVRYPEQPVTGPLQGLKGCTKALSYASTL